MNNFQRNIYRVEQSILCKTILSFDYKTVGSSTVTFAYILCGQTTETQATYSLPDSGGVFATYDLTDLNQEVCIIENSFRRVSGLTNVQNFVYSSTTC